MVKATKVSNNILTKVQMYSILYIEALSLEYTLFRITCRERQTIRKNGAQSCGPKLLAIGVRWPGRRTRTISKRALFFQHKNRVF